MLWCQIASRDHQNKRVINFLVSSFSSPFFPFPPPSPSSNPLRSPLSLPLSNPLSLHHHSLPPSGVMARWLQVAREGGRKGCREGGMEDGRGGGVGGRAAVICSPVHTITVPTNSLLSYFPQPNCSWISFRRTLLASEANMKNEVPQIAPCLGKQIQCFPIH